MGKELKESYSNEQLDEKRHYAILSHQIGHKSELNTLTKVVLQTGSLPAIFGLGFVSLCERTKRISQEVIRAHATGETYRLSDIVQAVEHETPDLGTAFTQWLYDSIDRVIA